jgi:hypothetical protein
VVDHLPIVIFGDAVDFHRVRFINEVEQAWKRMAEIETATTAVTDIEYPLKLFEQRIVVVEFVRPPVERVTCRRLEAAFALAHGMLAGPCGPAIQVELVVE